MSLHAILPSFLLPPFPRLSDQRFPLSLESARFSPATTCTSTTLLAGIFHQDGSSSNPPGYSRSSLLSPLHQWTHRRASYSTEGVCGPPPGIRCAVSSQHILVNQTELRMILKHVLLSVLYYVCEDTVRGCFVKLHRNVRRI